MSKQYDERDPVAQGDYYIRHVSAMTEEDLHSKAAIAAELAHRDIRIEQLEQQLAGATNLLGAAKKKQCDLIEENQRLRQALEAIAQSAVLDSTSNCSPLLDDYCAYAALILENKDWPHGTAKWLQPASPPGN